MSLFLLLLTARSDLAMNFSGMIGNCLEWFPLGNNLSYYCEMDLKLIEKALIILIMGSNNIFVEVFPLYFVNTCLNILELQTAKTFYRGSHTY